MYDIKIEIKKFIFIGKSETYEYLSRPGKSIDAIKVFVSKQTTDTIDLFKFDYKQQNIPRIISELTSEIIEFK